jgi:pimeloyl-ACP methyl ester carboxylesterase
MTIRERTMALDHRQLAWIEAGSGWPVLFIHAFPVTADMWGRQLHRVPEGWRFIAPDLRGFGQTPLCAPGESTPRLTVDDYASELGAFLDALEIDSAVIVGLSMGGYIAFAMHRQLPSRFAGLVLADTRSQADTADAHAGRLRMRKLLKQQGPSGVADQMLPKLLSERARTEQPDLVTAVRAMIEVNAAEGIDAAIGALMDRPDSTPDLARISCATMVLVGEGDEVTPRADAEAMHAAISRSTLIVVPAAGHLSNLEQPDAFSKALGDFLLARL